ncbi:cytochrome c [Bradyrhizobium sp.]|uniref:c-type cytochrome n=1 Tax=Bradyrhizobium sp. TaxID=376 RepID=UPI0023862899|nr:cytochrome c [Bradyrhizobium sp.]MDE1934827.1 cytochrome c [Bradyrhizobium sp.]
MKHRSLLTAVLIAIVFPAIAPAGAQQASSPAGNVEHGKALYRETGCYECHGLAGQGAPMTGPRVSRTQLPLDAFLNQLRHPVNQMPPYEAAVLSDSDAADIYAYLEQIPAPPGPNSIPLLKLTR